jgi:hypothetical protein
MMGRPQGFTRLYGKEYLSFPGNLIVRLLACCLIDLFLDPEDGCRTSLRTISEILVDYTE